MFGVKTPVFLFDALWREVRNRATQAIHADVMGMGQAIALCKSKVRNLQKMEEEEKCVLLLDSGGINKKFLVKNDRCNQGDPTK